MGLLWNDHHAVRLLLEWAFTLLFLCYIEGVLKYKLDGVTHKLRSIHGLDLLPIILVLQ
jgi:hypothetical protein